MTDDKKTYTRTASQKIQDEVRNKLLHEDIAWSYYRRPQTMRELLGLQAAVMKENDE